MALLRNQQLRPLEVFLGDWKTTAYRHGQAEAEGQTSFALIEDGAFLRMTATWTKGGPPSSISMIFKDQTLDHFVVNCFNAQGTARIYQMAFENGLWKMWRMEPHTNASKRASLAATVAERGRKLRTIRTGSRTLT